uniref:SHSP domain-containing protein n=1 Tax=Parascaris univalens TaxID=6257 RepID=A0A914ZD56_PARUN
TVSTNLSSLSTKLNVQPSGPFNLTDRRHHSRILKRMFLYPYSRPCYRVRAVPEHPVARVFDSALQDMDRSLRVLVPLIEHVSQQDNKGDNALASVGTCINERHYLMLLSADLSLPITIIACKR